MLHGFHSSASIEIHCAGALSPLAPRPHDENGTVAGRARTLTIGRRRCVPARRNLASGKGAGNTYDMVTTHRSWGWRDKHLDEDRGGCRRPIAIESGGKRRMSVVAHASPARCQRVRSGRSHGAAAITTTLSARVQRPKSTRARTQATAQVKGSVQTSSALPTKSSEL
jgi:hypothetical protein